MLVSCRHTIILLSRVSVFFYYSYKYKISLEGTVRDSPSITQNLLHFSSSLLSPHNFPEFAPLFYLKAVIIIVFTK